LVHVRDVQPLCPDMEGNRRGWFVYVVQLQHAANRDAVIRELAAEGIQSKLYLPAIHLMPHYRERFGYGPGDFPVAEDVAASSLALPFLSTWRSGRRGA
jgi:perosamine synthetase